MTPGAFWTLSVAEPQGRRAERAGAGVGLRVAAAERLLAAGEVDVPVLFVLATIAPLFVIVGPIWSRVCAVPGLRLTVVPGLIVRFPQTLSCPLRFSVLLFVVLSTTTLGVWPWTRKMKFVAVAAVPTLSVPPLKTIVPVWL